MTKEPDPTERVEVVEIQNVAGESVFINKSDFKEGAHKETKPKGKSESDK